MGRILEVARVAADPATVWNIIGDPTRIPQWFPSIASATMDGNIRTCMLHDGRVITEEILRSDPESRVLEYRILSGMTVDAHHGSVSVRPDGPVTLVTYETLIEPDEFVEPLRKSIRTALSQLVALMNMLNWSKQQND